MKSTDLFSNKSRPPTAETGPPPRRNRRVPAWLVPIAILLGFAAVFAIAFAGRLMPALEVNTSPTILLSDIEQKKSTAPASTDEAAANYSARMLFQAAGWFEPDPLPIRATALVDGVVAEVFVLEGAAVKKGQPLASLIPDDTQFLLQGAQRKLEQTTAEHHMHLANIPAVRAEAASVLDQAKSAEARLEELQDRYARINSLSEGTVSAQDITAARLAVTSQTATIASLKSDHTAVLARLEAINAQSKVFDAMIAAAEVRVSEAELALSRTEINSPVDGVVLELKAAPGQKKLLRMDDPDSATVAVLFETGKLQARVDVPLADARQLAPGQAALITSDFLPNSEFQGIVTRIVGTADLQRNTLQAKVRIIEPDPRLRPEMLCRVKFLESGQTNTTTTPTGSRAIMASVSALIDGSNDQAKAWIASLDGSRATLKTIELGDLQLDGYISVRSGLLIGERLILPPHDGLKEGRRIEATDTNR